MAQKCQNLIHFGQLLIRFKIMSSKKKYNRPDHIRLQDWPTISAYCRGSNCKRCKGGFGIASVMFGKAKKIRCECICHMSEEIRNGTTARV